MPSLQNLVLTDRASTPLNHTFVPAGIDQQNVGEVVNASSAGVPAGSERVTISMRKGGDGRYKGKLKFVFPILVTETVNGVSRPVVARTSIANVSFDFDETSTLQERKDAVGMVYSGLAPGATLVNNTLVNVESIW